MGVCTWFALLFPRRRCGQSKPFFLPIFCFVGLTRHASTNRRYILPHQYWASDEEIHVDQVFIEGAPYTRPDVFDAYLARARTATSANELHTALTDARRGLLGLGIFKSVRFVVDCAKDPRHTNIAIVTEEIPRKEYGVGVGGGGPDTLVLNANLSVLNLFGRGELWRSTLSHAAPGASEYSAYDALLRKPLLFTNTPAAHALTMALHYSAIQRAAEGRHREQRLGIAIGAEAQRGIAFSALKLSHEVRRLSPTYGATFPNVEQGGWRPRSAVSYEWSVDSRDHPLIATRGSLGKGILELAVDPAALTPLYLKAELAANVGVPLEDTFLGAGALLFRLRGGHILPLNGYAPQGHAHPSVSSIDAFHMGGAHLVPGFQTRGIARTSAQESLGSCTYWLASSHLVFGFGPNMPSFLKWQLHASACGVSDTLGTSPDRQGISTAFAPDSLRASAGIGLIAGLVGAGRLTLTWSRILRAQADDATTHYIQLGFTTSFD